MNGPEFENRQAQGDDEPSSCSYDTYDQLVLSLSANSKPRDFSLKIPPPSTHDDSLAQIYQQRHASALREEEQAGFEQIHHDLLEQLEQFYPEVWTGQSVKVRQGGPFRSSEGVAFKWYEFQEVLSGEWLLPDLRVLSEAEGQDGGASHPPERYGSDAVRLLTFIHHDGELQLEVLYNLHTIRDAISNLVSGIRLDYHTNTSVHYSHLRWLIESALARGLLSQTAEEAGDSLTPRDLHALFRSGMLGIQSAREESESDCNGTRRYLEIMTHRPPSLKRQAEAVPCRQRWEIVIRDGEALSLYLVVP